MADKYKVPTDDELKGAINTAHLILVDIDANSNKYWNGYCLANGDFYCEYGRVKDAKGDCRHDYYKVSDLKGKSNTTHMATKVKEKARKGYVEQKVAGSTTTPVKTSSKTVSSQNIKSIATKEIKGDAETKKLVSWLAEVNIHNITSATNISFDAASGAFTTPLGTFVTDDAVDEARSLLSSLQPFVTQRDWENRQYKNLLGQYLQLVPQDVGRTRGWHETFFSGSNALIEQNNILDSLAAALQDSTKADTDNNEPKKPTNTVFNVSLDVVKDDKIVSAIDKKYRNEKGNHGDVRSYKLKTVWAVEISTVRDAYRTHGKKLGNIKQLWHGTKASNLLSILKGGLVIPKGYDSHVTGAMFGPGLYFSDQSTKSIRYATNAWGYGGNTNRVFMFLADVAMGKEYVPTGPTSRTPPSGYNSYFAKGSQSGVMNNEMIVPNTYQCDLTYLIEFIK